MLARASWVAAAVVVVALAWLASAPQAHAHVSLRTSEPAGELTVPESPRQVVLEFSGPVEAISNGVQVFDSAGDRVDVGTPRPSSGTRIVQPVRAGAEGDWSVSYRVASEDGHVIPGYVGFVVGAPGGGGAAAEASREAASIPRTLEATFMAARGVEVLALLVLAGGGIFATVLAPGTRPRMLGVALAALLAAYGVGMVANAAILGGTGLVGALDGAALGATVDSPFGRALTIRAAVTVVAIAPVLLLRSGRELPVAGRWALAAVFAAVAASLSITGHAVTTEPIELRMPLDMVHVVAAAVWVGGLLQLGLLRESPSERIAEIARFSRAAFACVVVLLLTGAYATYAELGTPTPRELLDSQYGRLIAAKLLLYLGTMPFAWNNLTTFVPALERRPRDAPYMLRQYVARELLLLVAVVLFTVWLIATPQPG